MQGATWPRGLVVVALIALGLVATRVLGRGHPAVTQDQAVAIARPQIDFRPKGHTIRLVQRGIPPRAYWAVSFWTPKAGGGYKRVTVVLVDGRSGRIVEVRRSS